MQQLLNMFIIHSIFTSFLIMGLPISASDEIVGKPDFFNLEPDQPALLDVLANDSNQRGFFLEITATGEPLDTVTLDPCGTLVNQGDGSFIFSPDQGYTGTCRFEYQLNDGVETATATVILNLNGITLSGGEPVISASHSHTRPHGMLETSPEVDLNAYHILFNPTCIGTPCWLGDTCDNDCNEAPFWDQVNEFLAIDNGKPVIVSTDGAGAIWRAILEEVQVAIATHPKGTRHLEHFDQPFNQFAMRGAITSAADFETFGPEVNRRLTQLGNADFADQLDPWGTVSVEGDRVLWNQEPVTLMGFSLYGMLSTSRHNYTAYLDHLADKGVNFTREWCLEQWTGQCVGANGNGRDFDLQPCHPSALSPFKGSRPHNLFNPTAEELYNLNELNPDFFENMKTFVELAWERGIVVQISLFDRAGLRDNGSPGHWKHNPYNILNNQNDILTNDGQSYPQTFTDMSDTGIGAINSAFVRRVVETLRDYKNVIFEILNEPNHEFPADPATTLAWHEWIADTIHEEYSSTQTEPLSTTDPTSIAVQSGATAIFESVPSGASGEYTIRWYQADTDSGPWNFIQAGTPGFSGTTTSHLSIDTGLATDPEGWYRALVRDKQDRDDLVWSKPAQLTVTGNAISVTGPGDVQVNQGETALFQVQASGGSGEYTYRWYFSETEKPPWALLQNATPGISGATSPTLAVNTSLVAGAAGWYRAIVRDRNNTSDVVTTPTAQLVIGSEPLSVTNPVPASASVSVGGVIGFSVTASGGDGATVYRWQHSATGSGSWTNITAARFTGTQTPTLNLNGAQLADAGFYRCRVNDSNDTVFSGNAFLAVSSGLGNLVSIDMGTTNINQGIILATGPPSGDTVPVTEGPNGDRRECRKNRENDPDELHYRFFFKVDNGWENPNDPRPNLTVTLTYLDKTSGSLILQYNAIGNNAKPHPRQIALTNSNRWKTFTWQLTDAAFSDAMSHGADFRIHRHTTGTRRLWLDQVQVHTMSVAGPFPVNPTQPEGTNLLFSVNSPVGGSGPYTYQWTFEGNPISGANGSTLSLTNLDPLNSGDYACFVTDQEGKRVLTPSSQLTVVPDSPVEITGPGNQSVIELDTFDLQVTVNGGSGPNTYTWQKLEHSAWQNIPSNHARISGVATDTLTFDPVWMEDATSYRCKVTNDGETINSAPGVLTVRPFNRIEIDLGFTDITDRLTHSDLPPNGGTIGTHQGTGSSRRECRALENPGSPDFDKRMFFKVDDDWAFENSRPAVDIGIWYFDDNELSKIYLVYDAGTFGQRTDNAETHPVFIQLQGDQQWKFFSWQVHDAYFGNGQSHGSDFRVERRGSGDGAMFLDKVSVEGPLGPLTVSETLPGDLVREVNQSATFHVDVFGGAEPYSFQWLRNGQPLGNGATQAQLVIDNLTLADSGSYQCQVIDSQEETITSQAAQLTVEDTSPAFIDLGTTNVEDRLELVEPSNGTGDTEAIDLAQRNCRKNLNPGHDPGQDYRMYFRVNNTWAQDRRNLSITVTYFDTGSAGKIFLHYLSTTGVKPHANHIQLSGFNEPNGVWKSHTWQVDDAQFESNTQTHSVNFWLERNPHGSAERQWLVIDTVTLD